MKQSTKIHKRDFMVIIFALFIFWILLTADFSYLSLILGLVVSIIIGILTSKYIFIEIKSNRKTIKDYFFAIEHLAGIIFITIFRIIIANGQLIYQALTLNIEPKIVRAKINLKSDIEIALISNLITLTPGTLVIDIEKTEDSGTYLYIHFSYLKAKNLGRYIENTIGKWDEMIGALFK